MIKKIYADNFRCLVNFEFSPGPVSLVLGPNGNSGYTILNSIWRFLLVRVYSYATLWQARSL